MKTLKQRCILSVITFFVIFSMFYTFSDIIILYLTKSITDSGARIITVAPLETLYSKIYISSIATALLLLPYIITSLYLYIKPALYDNEINITKKICFPCTFAFISGFCLFLLCGTKYLIYFVSALSIDGIDNTVSLLKYIQFIACCGAVTGVLFCYPIFIYLINAIGLINKEMLKRYRKHTIVIAFIFGALVTPPDIITQCLIAMPLIILHEISIRVI